MTTPLRIRIVAAVDASVANVFTTMISAGKRAGKKMGEELAAGAQIGTGAYRSMPAVVKKATDASVSAAKGMQTQLGAVADGTKGKFDSLTAGLKKLPVELRAITAEAQKELAKIERLRAREALGLVRSSPGSIRMGMSLGATSGSAAAMAKLNPGFGARALAFGNRPVGMPNGFGLFGSVASRIGSGAVSGAIGLGADLLHGLGVNTDPASMFAESQKNEALFRDVSSFGYMPGTEGPNSKRVDPAQLLHESHKIGQRTGFTANEVGQGLEKFVGLTGDLDLGRKSLENMAVLSKATGSSFEEMVEAAGAASNTLGNMPNKAEVLYDVMKKVSSEGKTGAILIKDLATQMAKIASSAQMFSGDRAHTITILGAMAQEARGRGGAASASQAATSVQQFTNVFRKRQRLDTFTGFGMKTYDAGGGIRDPQQLIVESFVAAMRGGFRLTPAGKKLPMQGALGQKDPAKGWQNFETNLTALYGDVKAMRATAGFESVFKEGYTGKSGTDQEKLVAATAAVNEEFHRLTVDMMDEATVQEDFALAMKNSKSQVAVFNDRIQEVAEEFQQEMLPALISLAPEMVLLAKGAGDLLATLLGVKKPGAPVTDAQGAAAQAAAQKAIDLANKRDFLPGTNLPRAHRELGMGAPDISNAIPIPAETADLVTEHAAQLAGAVAAARGKLGAAKEERNKAFGYEGKSDAEIDRLQAEYKRMYPGNEASSPTLQAVTAAEKELMSAEQSQALATSVANGVKEGLKDGRFTVIIAEDNSKKPSGTQANQPAMHPDSQ